MQGKREMQRDGAELNYKKDYESRTACYKVFEPREQLCARVGGVVQQEGNTGGGRCS